MDSKHQRLVDQLGNCVTDKLDKLAAALVHFEVGFEILPGTKGPVPEDDLNAYEVGPIELRGE